MVNDVFFSELHIQKEEKLLIVDARTSDAVALAVRSDCPIFIKSEILDIVGTEIESSTASTDDIVENNEDLSIDDLSLMTIEALEDLLKIAVEEEKYELAVSIRDAIKQKK
jgi:bifunctional DNase/RNase